MALTKVGPKFQVTIPKAARVAAGIKLGDLMEATAERGAIVLRPKVLSDRDPELERQLEASEAAVKAGRVLGPFKSAGATMKAVKAYARRADRAVRR
jgi:AbrB family looped-hinge helix DNA binding protein